MKRKGKGSNLLLRVSFDHPELFIVESISNIAFLLVPANYGLNEEFIIG